MTWAQAEYAKGNEVHKKWVVSCMARLNHTWNQLKGPLVLEISFRITDGGNDDKNSGADALFAEG